MNFETLLQTERHILSAGSVYELLRRSPEVGGRIISFCGNTSDLSAAELDGMEELQTEDPGAFALVNKQLLDAHDIPIVGACCGSNPEHIREIAGFLKKPVSNRS